MAGKVEGDMEILVHISAPSTGKDDNHFRALAKAYQLFDSINCLSLTTSVNLDEDSSCVLSQMPAQALLRSRITHSNGDIQPPIDSLEVSFNSVLDNLESPALRSPEPLMKMTPPLKKPTPTDVIVEREASWNTPPSVIPDSQSPYNQAIPEFSSPTRVLELYLQHFDNSGPSPITTGAPRGSQAYDVSSSLLLDSSQTQTSPRRGTTTTSLEVIYDTPQTEHYGKSSTLHSKRRRFSSPKATMLSRTTLGLSPQHSHPGHVSPAKPAKRTAIPFVLPATSTSPLQKRRKVEVPAISVKPTNIKTLKTLWPQNIPNEIHPPPPRTSTKPLPPLITPALDLLATQLRLPSRYRPKSQKRSLRDLERGFWSVSMMTWPKALRDQAWLALSTYIGQGRAGWGIWCLLCDSRNSSEVEYGEGSERTPGNQGQGVEGRELTELRMYCWGGVVGHIYILLYLVSQRRVKGTGAKWIDGGGEVVIFMP